LIANTMRPATAHKRHSKHSLCPRKSKFLFCLVFRKEAERKEAERKEAERKEAERKEAEKQSAKRQSAGKRGAKRQGAKRQSAKKQSARRQSAEKQGERKQSAKRQSARKQSAKRQSAKRQRSRAQRDRAQGSGAQRGRAQRGRAQRSRAQGGRAQRSRAKGSRAQRGRAQGSRAQRGRAQRGREAERKEAERREAGSKEAGRKEAERKEAEHEEAGRDKIHGARRGAWQAWGRSGPWAKTWTSLVAADCNATAAHKAAPRLLDPADFGSAWGHGARQNHGANEARRRSKNLSAGAHGNRGEAFGRLKPKGARKSGMGALKAGWRSRGVYTHNGGVEVAWRIMAAATRPTCVGAGFAHEGKGAPGVHGPVGAARFH
jgi:hypothetical protein